MAALSLDPKPAFQITKQQQQHREWVVEEIEGLIKVYKDGVVERLPIIPDAPCTQALGPGITARDITIARFNNLWARIYVPYRASKLPLLAYFHGGGFCVGSAAWLCYHNFLANLASEVGCIIISANYRLAPENRLPSAYEDCFNTVMWLQQQALSMPNEQSWWLSRCDFSRFFLAGDSAGANIAYNVAIQLGSNPTTILKPLYHTGIILIQPFFGGEMRTASEKAPQPPHSALTLAVADAYWRLSLPPGAGREHPWCNPLRIGASKLGSIMFPAMMVCISETDILKDRNVEFVAAMAKAGKVVEMVVYRGVGHAFHVLDASPMSQSRTQEMISHLKAFIVNK
ncbi:hypothetical protein Nepgr_020868 [Nepenthes gracilis]|uniref:Alpha/beta hydrolase fold-3 domain-containing protein n=1 Tax=Nepenthes gracilis TaxID=150966 RepID=A0AAD3SXQ5_NEPGR|nr:hypothetical protein Nepgr_020868 [Nepenthes gracilis]